MLEELSFSSILVPIDGSPKSYDAVRYASKVSRIFEDCSIVILYVVKMKNSFRLSLHQGTKVDSQYVELLEKGEEKCLEAIREAKKCGCSDFNLESKMVIGSPEEEIIKMAADYDLIIIGLRDKEYYSDNLIENITIRVANSSKIPVLVVP